MNLGCPQVCIFQGLCHHFFSYSIHSPPDIFISWPQQSKVMGSISSLKHESPVSCFSDGFPLEFDQTLQMKVLGMEISRKEYCGLIRRLFRWSPKQNHKGLCSKLDNIISLLRNLGSVARQKVLLGCHDKRCSSLSQRIRWKHFKTIQTWCQFLDSWQSIHGQKP